MPKAPVRRSPKKRASTLPTAKASKTGVRAQPLTAVRDVKASSRWYSRLLGVEGLGGHEHRAVLRRARSLRAAVVEEPHVNPAPNHREMWLRDPDGYVVVIARPDGEAARA